MANKNRIECPECGHMGPHEDNGSRRLRDLSYCCGDCGTHFDAAQVVEMQLADALTRDAELNIAETGCDPFGDVAALAAGRHTVRTLLAHCLDGADQDRVQGWREYVAAVSDAAEVVS